MTVNDYTIQFGKTNDLYVEYIKRSQPFSMTTDHYHSYYEIYYLLSGERLYFIRDRSYAVEQGDIVFISKQELHKTMHSGSPSLERAVIHFNDDLFGHSESDHASLLLSPFRQESHVLRLPKHEKPYIEQLMRRMLREMNDKLPGYELIPRNTVTELLLIAARSFQTLEPVQLHNNSPIHAKMFEIVHYINHHYAEPLTLARLSQQFYISPYYLSRIFKQTTGFAFSEYMILTRVKEAQRLLRHTLMSISGIAAAVGFDSFSHFGKTFKRVTKQSPREYRKNHAKLE